MARACSRARISATVRARATEGTKVSKRTREQVRTRGGGGAAEEAVPRARKEQG